MLRKIVFLGLLVGLLLSACVPSIHPLYDDKTLVSDPALVGRFVDPDNSESWTFAWDGDSGYDLTVKEKDQQGQFKAHLLELDGHRYMDLFPIEQPSQSSDFYRMHLVPAHSFLAVTEIGDNLHLAVMDPQWTEEYLAENPNALDHTQTDDDRIVLTAATSELQKFVAAHRSTLFDEGSALKREKPTQ